MTDRSEYVEPRSMLARRVARRHVAARALGGAVLLAAIVWIVVATRRPRTEAARSRATNASAPTTNDMAGMTG
ncbi:MAG TPA: hypothetical protein VFG69_05455, partial [Nannocystaceae bacterium]|nr:hypothetical protein [Nannocystaceae bacterium]